MTTTATAAALSRLPTPPDTRPHLIARVVFLRADVLTMAHVRNECRKGFSNDTSFIDDARQLRWWEANKLRVQAWLYADGAGQTVGYGCLRQGEDGRWFSSCAVLPQFGGQGHGRAILAHMVTAVDHEVWAAASPTNDAAQRLHNHTQWEAIGADMDHIYYRTRPRVRTVTSPFNLDALHEIGGA
jgi:GNAT superfamily N-acetyltransferase